ncbi:FadR/GntR family transcriptional regulator [Streptomyces aidingensis]|uniref:DNA-binding transcriptional regulator, FadR family n=1 Tax=Streptomyces aidingensis TaxID=910347 RepID=A0A1I1PJ09_9ACTN|nr:FCD domain-containing protein [Streptomyces aidingensis]SFC87690.1 DNA-binding transcriptional regulator, FadR family [Streptomyces aidingensis]SFD09819.1 DNA-binding transcriptional regulator, FadR family [Streptomyces aidingensis]
MAAYSTRGVHGQVVQSLGARIVGGAVPEGATLDVRALGEELDVSLTVMRESLKVLAGKGLVDARQKRGTFVRGRKHWNLLDADVIRWRVEGGAGEELMRDLADVRSIIEPAAALRAALHRTDADLGALEAALDLMGRARADSAVAAEADAAFHRALLAATGNEMLARMDMLLEPGLRERDRLVHAHASVGDPVPSHRAVLDAVRDRDPARAELAMLGLLAKAVEDLDHVTGRTADPADRESPHGAR